MEKTKIIIAGYHDLLDYAKLCRCIDKLLHHDQLSDKETEILGCLSDETEGAFRRFALENHFSFKSFFQTVPSLSQPDSASLNTQIAKYATKDSSKSYLVAFWDGEQDNTSELIDTANRFGISTFVLSSL